MRKRMSKALVMSGGGPVGLAWETGLVAGLSARGFDLGSADLFLGTSAGASVCAQIALGRDLGPVVERYRGGAPQLPSEGADGAASVRGATMVAATPGQWGATGPMLRVGTMMSGALSDGLTPEQARAVVGRYAIEAETVTEESFVNFFRHLRGERWPARFACTAVDAETGEFVVWNAENPADLERAVASSSSAPGVFPPVTIDGRRYIDAGGIRSGTSADLASGYDRVLVVTLRDPNAATDGNAQLERSRKRVVDECKLIEDAGGTVATLAPDASAAVAMGSNPHDSSVNPVAAAHGLRQGEAEADRLREFWN